MDFRTHSDGTHYPVRSRSGHAPPKHCPKCGATTSWADLEMHGMCWYCWVDTGTDETAQYIRSKGLYMVEGRKSKEILRRRALREKKAAEHIDRKIAALEEEGRYEEI